MFVKISVLAAVFFFLSGPALAINFSGSPLASYEPQEYGDLDVSSQQVISWLPGNVDGVPQATNGNYVLKLAWENASGPKIEIKHIWNRSTFDLTDVNYILVDVYIATASALPSPETNSVSIWSFWDSNPHWSSCESVPPAINQWFTVGFNVSNYNYNDLNNIDALTFTNMPGTDGTIYIDNLRLLRVPDGNWPHIRRKVNFSGYWWSVLQSDYTIGSGPSCFTDDQNDIWTDTNGLHLSIVKKDPNWYCSEVVANNNLGYGTYVFTIGREVNSLDPNVIVGLFFFDVNDKNDRPHEIDVELTRWGNQAEPNVGQFVIQPWYHTGNRFRFPIVYSGPTDITTYEIKWTPARVDFKSYYGDYSPNPPVPLMISSWSYTGSDIPQPAEENPRINFYLANGKPPKNGQNAQITIKSFRYLPLGDLDNDGKVDFLDFALFSDKWLWGTE